MKKILIFSPTVFFFSALPLAVLAIEYPFGGMGENPTPDQYIHALFIWGAGIVGAMAVVGIAFGGIMYIMGKIDQGKDIIYSSLLGLLFLLGSWLILYVINPNLVKLTPPPLESIMPLTSSGSTGDAGSGGGYFSQSTINYVRNAPNLNGLTPAQVAAIIQAESSGNPTESTASSYGLMQIKPETARALDPQGTAGMSDQQIAQKLMSDPNYNIDLGTKYYSSLLKKYNGDMTLASAAYNGGEKANLPSKDCPGLLAWQCPWDNPEHTKPNIGYNETRQYINNINNYIKSWKD